MAMRITSDLILELAGSRAVDPGLVYCPDNAMYEVRSIITRDRGEREYRLVATQQELFDFCGEFGYAAADTPLVAEAWQKYERGAQADWEYQKRAHS
jgi:hypothetical protein